MKATMRSDVRRTATGLALTALALAGATSACARGEGAELGAVATVAAQGASNPTAALGPKGIGYVAWVGAGPGGNDVYLAHTTDGHTFSAPVRVNDRDGDAAPHEQAPAQVAVGPDGSVYVAWQNNTKIPGRRFPASNLRFARSTDGGRTFSPAISVNDDTDSDVPSSHTFHNIAVASDGTIYVAWLDGRVRDRMLAEREKAAPASGAAHGAAASAKAHTSGGTQAAEPAGHGTGAEGGMAGMQMHGQAAGGEHDGMAGMQMDAHDDDPTLPGSQIRFAVSTDGGRSFGPNQVVDDNTCPCCRVSLATAPDGSVYVAWRKIYPGNVRDVVVARKAPGEASFGAPVRVHDDRWVFPGCPHAGPSLAVDASGRVHVAWYTGAEKQQGLWYAVSSDQGRTFGEPAPLEVAAWVPPSQVKLAARGDTVWAAWDDRRQEQKSVTLARAVGDAAPKVVAEAVPGASPAVAAGASGAVVAWLDGQTVRAREVGGSR